MAVSCSVCGSGQLHPSRLRARDLGQLLKLRIPVRCYSCMNRDYISIFKTGKLKVRRRRRHKNSSHLHSSA